MRVKVVNAFLLFLFCTLTEFVIGTGSLDCPPLSDRSAKNVQIRCFGENTKEFNCGDLKSPFPQGTLISFDCLPWFRSNQDLSSTIKREVRCVANGKWVGLKHYLNFACTPECGKLPRSQASLAIASGKVKQNFNKLPWEVSISGHNPCKGVLIPALVGNASAVLTSRKCVPEDGNFEISTGQQRIQVKAVSFSEEGLGTSLLALLNLEQPVTLSSNVLPACLPNFDDDLLTAELGQVGIYQHSHSNSNVKAKIIGCSKPRFSQQTQFCVESRENKCPILGSGFYISDSSLSPRYHLLGIQGEDSNCKSEMTFINLESYLDWIHDHLEDTIETHSCTQTVTSTQPPQIVVNNRLNIKKGCPSLKGIVKSGHDVQCQNGNRETLDCESAVFPARTTVTFSCKSYYVAPLGGSRTARIQCQHVGSEYQWTLLPPGFRCSLGCGERSQDKDSFITGGFTSVKGNWPWVTAMYTKDPQGSGSYEFLCGGTLISENAVLTAGHCVAAPGTSNPRDKSTIYLQFAKFSREFEKIDSETQERGVHAIHIHPYYNHLNLDSDVAVIILDKAVAVTEDVHPVCLPTSGRLFDAFEDNGHLASLVGWGRLLNGSFPEALQEARVPFISYKECQASHPSLGQLVRPSTNFCAGYRNSTGACDGDSGGGLFHRDTNPALFKKWTVVGLVSGGVADWTGACRAGHFSMFTKVSNFRDWISDMVENHAEDS